MKKLMVILCLVFALSLSACTKPRTPDEIESSTSISEEAVFKIEAAGLELKYPAKWQDAVTVSVKKDKASFSCGDTALFDILFNQPNEGILLGTVKGEQNTVITVESHELKGDNNELRAMQDGVNVILDYLIEDYDFVSDLPDEPDQEVFEIPTSVVTLKYPEKWKDQVTVKVSKKKVRFLNEGTPLFDLVFSEGEGYLLGHYNGTPIYVVEYQVSTEEQIQMKDDVNVILRYLNLDEAFE